jgi:beta-barrel assembly-enhancing protease
MIAYYPNCIIHKESKSMQNLPNKLHIKKIKIAILPFYILLLLLGCGINEQSLFVCSCCDEVPTGVPETNPEEQLKEDCGVEAEDLSTILRIASKECQAYAQLRFALECMKNNIDTRIEISQQQNDAIIQNLASKIRKQVKQSIEILESDKGSVKYVRIVGNRIANKRTTSLFTGTFTFDVYKNGPVNAFATPGGYIYISDALVDALDESELAFVLGHEVAHIEWASYHEEILKELGAWSDYSRILDNIKKLALTICEGAADELFVDFYGVVYAKAAGYDPNAGARFFLANTFEDGKFLSDFSALESHPPNTIRAYYAWDAARYVHPKARFRWPGTACYKGFAGSKHAWNGVVPAEVIQRCKQP